MGFTMLPPGVTVPVTWQLLRRRQFGGVEKRPIRRNRSDAIRQEL